MLTALPPLPLRNFKTPGIHMSYPHYRSQSVPAIDIDENFKRSLRKRVEYKLTHRFYDAQEKRDAALNATQDDEERARATRQFEETINHLKIVAEEEYQSLLRFEIANRRGVERREEPVESRILDSIQRGDGDHITYPMRAPSAQGAREHGVRRPSFTTTPHPEIWRPPTTNPEPSGIARSFAHAHATARPPTAPPQMRRGSTSGGLSGQGISTASEQARAGRYTPNPAQQTDHWNRINRPRAPSDALGRQSPAIATAGRTPGSSASAQRWEYPRASRPIATAGRAAAHDTVAFPSGSPSGSRQYGSPSSPSDARQGIAIPRSRFGSEDTGRSASYGGRWGSFRQDIVRESPESDEEEGDEDEEVDEQSNGEFAHSLDLEHEHSPEDRRRLEEKDRLLAVRLQKEEVRVAKEQEKRRKDNEDMQEEFRRREGQYYRRAVERERQTSVDMGRNGVPSPASWTSNHRASPGPSSGKDERRKALLEQEMLPTSSSSRSRQQGNAVAGPSGSRSSRSSSKADLEAMDRKISSMRTKVEECLEEMVVEMMDLRNRQLEDAGEDDDGRTKVMTAYTASMENLYRILEEFNSRLQCELRDKKREIAFVMGRVHHNGIRIQ
ncbi:hypothetical protein K488DRAFT_81424 [Vararia minispora EC-137]|uniref:Uncharacterized protein n=1 Tax=Vararia minispora EC-137 TaxID=1314806 RepID=A0ACB8QZX4_9AGAM|nr:hypothetical protein K488DRAFT_81424 [Vararia minispora EC-137]